MSSPNPARITAAMWRLWTDRPVSAWRLGGIYANKSGYHSSRAENEAKWPGNYSIRVPLDRQGPADKAAAIDYTMSDAEIRRRTAYLLAASERRDPRLAAVREWYGTIDGRTVVGRIKDGRDGPWRASSADSSHLWHVHISVFRAYTNTWEELAPILSVLAGETLGEWQARRTGRGGDPVIGLRKGDKGEAVTALQALLRQAGYDPGEIDGDYGPKTAAAVLAARRSVGSGVDSGDTISGWAYAQLMTALARAQGKPGPKGDRGPSGPEGPPGPAPTPEQIRAVVEPWLEQHKEELRGPAGRDGKTPTRIVITGDVIETA